MEREYTKLVNSMSWIEKGLRNKYRKVGREYVIMDDDEMYMTITTASTMSTFKFEVYFINRSKDNMSGYLRSFKKFDIELDTDEHENVCFYVTTKTDHIKMDVIGYVLRLFDILISEGRDSDEE